MKIEFIYTTNFKKDLKPLAKKYRSLQGDLRKLQEELEENPYQGAKIGEHTYKVRIAIKSKGKGKSSGARVITHLPVSKQQGVRLYFLAIYDKSEQENIKDFAIQYLIEEIEEEEQNSEDEDD